MPRRTYGPNRPRPHTHDALIQRLSAEFERIRPRWEERREQERANRPRNKPRSY